LGRSQSFRLLRNKLVPSVRQSGDTVQLGRITKQGTPLLRATVVQAAHVLLSRCRGPAPTPLHAIGLRIRGIRGRRKIAVVVVARHLVRIAFSILRAGTTYDAGRLDMLPPTPSPLFPLLTTPTPHP